MEDNFFFLLFISFIFIWWHTNSSGTLLLIINFQTLLLPEQLLTMTSGILVFLITNLMVLLVSCAAVSCLCQLAGSFCIYIDLSLLWNRDLCVPLEVFLMHCGEICGCCPFVLSSAHKIYFNVQYFYATWSNNLLKKPSLKIKQISKLCDAKDTHFSQSAYFSLVL